MPTVKASAIVIRPFRSSDVHEVRELHSKLLPVRYPPSFFIQLLVLPNRTCFVAYVEGHLKHPIGFISAAIQRPSLSAVPRITPNSTDISPSSSSVDLTKPRLEILTLGVLPTYQHCGLARLLMTRLIESIRVSCATINPRPSTLVATSDSDHESTGGTLIQANVSTSNIDAIKFYEKMGLKISSPVIRNLYRTLSSGSRDAYLVTGVI